MSVNTITSRVLSKDQKPFSSSTPDIDVKAVASKPEPHWWYDNSRSVTELFHCLSCVFPEGEAFFVRSVSHYVKNEKYQHLVDAQLKRDASAFITQEMHHSIEHRAYNKSIEMKYGHDDIEKTNGNIKRSSTLLESAPLVGHIILLSITCSLEHVTALLGELLLGTAEGNYVLDHMAPSHRSIWAWHAIEEMEHKSVAFDVYAKVAKGGYLLRVITHILATLIFLFLTIIHVWKYLFQGGEFFSIRNHKEFFKFLFIFPGLLPKALPLWLEYFSPHFHPSCRDNSKLIAEWSAKLKSDHFSN